MLPGQSVERRVVGGEAPRLRAVPGPGEQGIDAPAGPVRCREAAPDQQVLAGPLQREDGYPGVVDPGVVAEVCRDELFSFEAHHERLPQSAVEGRLDLRVRECEAGDGAGNAQHGGRLARPELEEPDREGKVVVERLSHPPVPPDQEAALLPEFDRHEVDVRPAPVPPVLVDVVGGAAGLEAPAGHSTEEAAEAGVGREEGGLVGEYFEVRVGEAAGAGGPGDDGVAVSSVALDPLVQPLSSVPFSRREEGDGDRVVVDALVVVDLRFKDGFFGDVVALFHVVTLP